MGMVFRAKHLDDRTLVECGYGSFGGYRIKVAHALDPLFGMMYEGFYGADWETDESGRQYAETCINIEDYIRENIEIENPEYHQVHKGKIPPEVKELEKKIREFTYGSAIDDVRIEKSFWVHPNYQVSFRLSWEKMCEWVDDHLTEAHQNLLFAPDAGGKWSWQECRELYKAYKDLDVEYHYRHAYDHTEEMHGRMLKSWYACWKNRCQLSWS